MVVNNKGKIAQSSGNILNFYNSLSEKDRRYAAIEAVKSGYGGVTYIRSILRCDDRTITRGLQELKEESEISQHQFQVVG